MLFFSKKRIGRMGIIIICGAFILSCANTIGSKNTTETVALPIENKVIILDAGHGFPDERS